MSALRSGLALAVLFAGFVRAATLTPEQLLPADTIGVITSPDWPRTRALLENSNYGRLWQDPEMRPFRERTLSRLRDGFLEPVEKQLGLKWSDYSEFLQGQLTFALLPASGPTNSFGYLLIIDARGKAPLLQTNLAALKKKWSDNGRALQTEKIRDVEFTKLLFTGEDVDDFWEKTFPDPEAKKKKKDPARKLEKFDLYLGLSDSLLLLGTRAADLEKVLARKAGGVNQPLADHPSFQAMQAPLFKDASAFAWLNFKPIYDTWARKFQGEPGRPRVGGLFVFKPDRALAAAGLAGLRTVGLKLGGNASGRLIEAFLDVPEASRKDIFKLIAADGADSSPPPFVPIDATKFRRWRLDGKQVWNQLESILLGIAPEMAGLLQISVETIGKDKDPNFDFRRSFIANLGNDFMTYQKAPRSLKPEDVDSPPSIYLIGSPKADEIAVAFKATSSLMPPPMSSGVVKQREFLGRTIYSVPMDGIDIKNGALNFSGSGGYLAITTDIALLEEYLRSGEANRRPLSEVAGLREAAETVGGFGLGLFGVENQAQTMRTTIEGLKGEGGGLDRLLAAGGAAGNKIRAQENDIFDFSILPPFERISKYFGLAVFSGSTTPQGLNFKLFVPTPPGLKQ